MSDLIDAIGLKRVSTDSQDNARQGAALERLIKKWHLNMVDVLELHAVSGTDTLNNSQVQELLDRMKRSPNIRALGVAALDRFIRPGKRYGQFGALDWFVDNSKVIYSDKEGLIDPSSDEGYDKCIMAGGRAGAEWRILKSRTHDGRIEHLKTGKLDHGSAPYGYVYIPKWQNGWCFEINPEQAKVVRKIFEWRRGNTPIYAICKELNQSGIPSAKGGKWSRQVVQQLLHNTAYKGEHRRFGIVIQCPSIIDLDTWNEVQDINQKARTQHTGRPSRNYLLRGFLWCGRCGRRCITFPNHTRPNYRCGNFIAKPPFTRICNAPSVTQSVIEAFAWTEIWRLLSDPALLIELTRAYYASIEQPDNNTASSLEKDLTRLRAKLSKTQAMVQDDLIDYVEGRSEIRSLQAQIKTREAEIRSAGKVLSLPPATAAEAAVRKFLESPEPSTYAARRVILEGILDLKLIYDSGDLTIEGKIPVPEADPVESIDYRQKKCKRLIDDTCTSTLNIPFKINVKVA